MIMKTIIKINPLPEHFRLAGDSEEVTTIEKEGHLTSDQAFAVVYPRAAELGHTASTRTYQDWSYSHE